MKILFEVARMDQVGFEPTTTEIVDILHFKHINHENVI